MVSATRTTRSTPERKNITTRSRRGFRRVACGLACCEGLPRPWHQRRQGPPQAPSLRCSMPRRGQAAVQCCHGVVAALDKPGRTEGVRKIAARFGVDPSTVQRISRPFESEGVAGRGERGACPDTAPAPGAPPRAGSTTPGLPLARTAPSGAAAWPDCGVGCL
jgi:hypothetical protein